MKRLDMLLLLASLSTVTIAQEITVDAAKDNALQFLSRQSVGPKYAKGTASASDLTLAYTSKSEGKTCFYVFNVGNDDGFVIAGGDEAAQQILGYSTHGTFDYDQAPDNLRWWLSQYTEQIAHAEAPSDEALAASAAHRAKAASTRNDVAPLVPTTWNQDYPYNSEIPVYDSYGSRYATGCVATAMAQVMKRWNYPNQGQGSYSYTSSNRTFSADFGNTTYDWDNMLTSYKGVAYTDENVKAVGTLMYHAGVAVRMSYGTYESSAFGLSCGSALVKYFGYDKSVRQEARDYFSDEAWEELIYNELSAGRPVLYSGDKANSSSGHEFVCDGYQASTNMFHMNWGWGGVYNNYFTLRGDNTLVPSGLGTGGYNRLQEVTVNIKPDEGGDPTPQIVLQKISNPMSMTVNNKEVDDYAYDKTMGSQTATYTIRFMNSSCVFNQVVYFPDDANVNVQAGVKVVDRETSTVQYYNVGNPVLLKSYDYLPSVFNTTSKGTISFELNDFQYNGTYEFHPVFHIEGSEEWKDIEVLASEKIPTITIMGAENRIPGKVHFVFSNSELMVEESVPIKHDSNYQGAVTYSSSNPAVATVDAQGVVTGVSAGTTEITVKGEADPDRGYQATETTIEVKVLDKFTLHFTIEETDNLAEGDVLHIKWEKDYDGKPIFTSSDPAIATINAGGRISCLAAGTVEITAVAPKSTRYLESQATFTFTVHPLKLSFVEEPYFNNDNNAYRKDIVLYYTVRNDCGMTHDIRVAGYLDIDNNIITCYGNHSSVPDGGIVSGSINFEALLESMEWRNKRPNANQEYTVELTMNNVRPFETYPTATFIYRNTLELDYGVSPAGYGTLILPFNADVPEGMTVYSCTEVDANGVLNLQEESSIVRNVPYIVKATYGESYKFVGPEAIDADNPSFQEGLLVGAVTNNVPLQKNTDYILQIQNDVAAFYQYTGTPSINPSENDADGNRLATQYRAFLRFPTASAPKFSLPGFPDDEPEGIKEITTPSTPSNTSNFSNTFIYSPDGHRRSTFQKGLNILILDDGTAQKIFVK